MLVYMAKRVLDRFDMEAERESAAIRRLAPHICKPFGWNRGILKQRRMHKDGEARVECRTIKQTFTRGYNAPVYQVRY
jgi:hypothetical protein